MTLPFHGSRVVRSTADKLTQHFGGMIELATENPGYKVYVYNVMLVIRSDFLILLMVTKKVHAHKFNFLWTKRGPEL